MRPTAANATDISAALAAHAETVCRHFLPNGRRQGRYWVVGDIHGSPGKSLFVRLHGPGRPGKFTDAATGHHGDLLDIIHHQSGSASMRHTLATARAFLALSSPPTAPPSASIPNRNTVATARRLWRSCQPIAGTHAEAYLHARAIRNARRESLRFHPSLYYREDDITRELPALVAAATDRLGNLQGVHRTYLDPRHPAKARVANPKKALGYIIGACVTFPSARSTSALVVGEGIETVLSILTAYPAAAGVATLSAAGLGSFAPPPGRRIAIARDRGEAGMHSAMRLAERCMKEGNIFRILPPLLADFNDDLVAFGPDGIRRGLSPL